MIWLYMYFINLLFFCSSIVCSEHNFNITFLKDIKHDNITYIKCHEQTPFKYEPFPLKKWEELQPEEGVFQETFILKIPDGEVCSRFGWIKMDNNILLDFIPPNCTWKNFQKNLNDSNFNHVKKIPGRVAVLTRVNHDCYAHWMRDILGRLALLEIAGVEYDFLYVPQHQPFMKKTLALWGIDPAKIIEPIDDNECIQADELIVPSLTFRRIVPEDQFFAEQGTLAAYYQVWLINYFRAKFLPQAEEQGKNYNFSKRIFISRKDAKKRQVNNEDEIFDLFEPLGFKRYILSDMSTLEQIILFHQAETIVAAHGSGLFNLIFCEPGTELIEIFQARSDCTHFYLSQTLQLNYQYIQTQEFKRISGHVHTNIPVAIIQDFIKTFTKTHEMLPI